MDTSTGTRVFRAADPADVSSVNQSGAGFFRDLFKVSPVCTAYRAVPVIGKLSRIRSRFDPCCGTTPVRFIFKCITDITPVEGHGFTIYMK